MTGYQNFHPWRSFAGENDPDAPLDGSGLVGVAGRRGAEILKYVVKLMEVPDRGGDSSYRRYLAPLG
jgi:hypothetical protein